MMLFNPASPTAILAELLTGVFLLLYGVRFLSDALQRVISGRMQEAVTRLSKYQLATFAIGIGGTALMQSSVAVASLLVELVSAGLLPLGVAIVMMLGSNVGATLVVQLLTLRITDHALELLGLGVMIALFTHRTPFRRSGRAVFAFALIVLGLAVIEIAGRSFVSSQVMKDVLQALADAPLVLVVIGAMLAVLLNSSTASIGLVMVLATGKVLSPTSALVLMLGANIGNTVVTMFASMGGTLAGRRLALVHCGTKLLGAVVFLILILPISTLLSQIWTDAGTQVALGHMGFNLALAVVFVPLSQHLARLMERLLPDKSDQLAEGSSRPVLDPRALVTPAIAHGLATRETLRMANIVTHMFELGMLAFKEQPDIIQKRIEAMDDQLDELDAAIKGYLAQLDEEEMTEEQVRKDITLFTIVGDLEAIGDLITHRFMGLARRLSRGKILFSEEGWEDLRRYYQEIEEALQQVTAALAGQNPALVAKFLERKPELKKIKRELHLRHIRELRAGIPNSTASSAVYLDLLDALSAVLAHTSNIAYALQEASSLRFYGSFRSLRTGQSVQLKFADTQQLDSVPQAGFATGTGSLLSPTGSLRSVPAEQSVRKEGPKTQQLYAVPQADFATEASSQPPTSSLRSVHQFSHSQQLNAVPQVDFATGTGSLLSSTSSSLRSVHPGQSVQKEFSHSQQLYATWQEEQAQEANSLSSTGSLRSAHAGQSVQVGFPSFQQLYATWQEEQAQEANSLPSTGSLQSERAGQSVQKEFPNGQQLYAVWQANLTNK